VKVWKRVKPGATEKLSLGDPLILRIYNDEYKILRVGMPM